MIKLGSSALLLDQQNNIIDGQGKKQVLGVCIKSPLNGTLTVYGISNTDGTAASWVIPSADSGYQAPPGSGLAFALLSYSFSNALDAGSAFIAWA